MFPAAPAARRTRVTLTAMLGLAALTLLAALPMPVHGSVSSCSRVAAAGGSDSAAGTADAPFRTGQKLANALQPGQVGCVRGTLTGDVTVVRPDITLTSEPGQRGRLVGKLWIAPEGPRATVRDLDLDGRRTTGIVIGPVVTGDDATFTGNDVTNAGAGICFIIGASGHDGDERADRTRIEGNRIHDCGTSNNHQHGIYVEHALDTRIVGNEIYDNADRGVQLYPYALSTTIAGNVIDGNGEGIAISGLGDRASSGTRVRGNLITNTRLRAGIESWFPDAKGTDNLVEGNCFAGARQAIDTSGGGFLARDNLFVDPQYVDRQAKDFRLRDGSPCAALLAAGRAGAPIPPVASEPPEAPEAPVVAAPQAPAPALAPAPASAPAATRPAPGAAGAAAKPAAPQPAADAAPASSAARVRFRVMRLPSRRARVRVRLEGGARSARAVLEIRSARGQWRPFAAPLLRADGDTVVTVRIPRGVRRLQLRAEVVEEDQPVVAELTEPPAR
jgi:nitrous oxidase accessory protein NosD